MNGDDFPLRRIRTKEGIFPGHIGEEEMTSSNPSILLALLKIKCVVLVISVYRSQFLESCEDKRLIFLSDNMYFHES